MAKVQPQQKEKALQIMAALAASLAESGMLPSDKFIRNTCLTALRLARQMDQVIALVEEHEELLTDPVDVAYAAMHKIVRDAEAKTAAATKNAALASVSDEAKDAA